MRRYIKLMDGRKEVIRARLTDEQVTEFEKYSPDVQGVFYKGDYYRCRGLSSSFVVYEKQLAITLGDLVPTPHHDAWYGEAEDYKNGIPRKP